MERQDKNRSSIRRLIVKVGTSTLTHSNTGKLNIRRVEQLASILADLHNRGIECILVSSGAIGIGQSRMNLNKKRVSLSEKQALAAIGQGLLMHIYEKKFSEYGILSAQVLLTKDDMIHRERFLNARNTIQALLRFGVVPVINENDTVSNEEIKFGDNDSLAALVAVLIDADLIVLLTDIDGLYTANPRLDAHAKPIPFVSKITPEIEQMAGSAGSEVGTGGMITKIEAAKIATSAGIPLVIAHGENPNVLDGILRGETAGTRFGAESCHLPSRKSWIVFGSAVKGRVVIDDGAVKALVENGKSLLPIGLIKVEGGFRAGEVVDIADSRGTIVARGIINYDSGEAEKIKGLHSDDLASVLGSVGHDVLVHRDNMGLL